MVTGVLAAGLLGLGVTAPSAAAVPPTAADPSAVDRLLTGEGLHPGQQLCAAIGLYCLKQQSWDGNLSLYRPGVNSRRLWTANTSQGYLTVMQGDGNLVSYDYFGRPVWASNTAGNGPSTFYVQGDGNLVVYRNSDGRATWASNTVQAVAPPQPANLSDRLLPGEGQYRGGITLRSPNGRYFLRFDADWGTLALAAYGGASYWTMPFMDGDWLENRRSACGLYVERSDGIIQWQTSVAGRVFTRLGPCTLVLQDNGDLAYIRNGDGAMLWHSNTIFP